VQILFSTVFGDVDLVTQDCTNNLLFFFRYIFQCYGALMTRVHIPHLKFYAKRELISLFGRVSKE
jgi:hypothetical protein